MLIVEVNGTPGTAHPAARLFIKEGFLPTAMGLQARVPPKSVPEEPAGKNRKRESTSTDREQLQRERTRSTAESNPTDPDSADADVNRDDLIDES